MEEKAGPPPASPESLAPSEHDAAFGQLIETVAAELPRLEEAELRAPLPRVQRSGVYTRSGWPWMTSDDRSVSPQRAAGEETVADDVAETLVAGLGPRPSWTSEQLRVDVDGLFPTMTISGSIFRLFGGRLTWIARVTVDPSTGDYVGPISYRDGPAQLEPHTDIRCKLTGSRWNQASLRAHVTFTGGGAPDRVRNYRYQRPNFRTVGIEFDSVAGTTSVTSYSLNAHPNRPVDLPAVTLTIEGAFTRQGLRMTKTSGDDVIPIDEAGTNLQWSDIEMHDAMQRHWSKWADVPQWQVWTLFAGRHEAGFGLGGIMFDDIGAAQRQGCAVFMDSFISNPAPPGDPAPAAYVQRMRFWTAVHEIGHTFNLAHSWQKHLGTPWIPLAPAPEERSFMNYPYNVTGGAAAFFADFYYRFSDDELVFMRHAPERFVEQGNAAWFDHHGFEQARVGSTNPLELTLRFNRATTRFEALEPVIAEVRLKNTSAVPVVVDENTLVGENLVVIIERAGKDARNWAPYQRYCRLAQPRVLQPGEALYAPLYLSAGLNGFDLADPGRYRLYAALRTDGGDVFSTPVDLTVARFASREQERLADDLFDDEAGRTLAFGGTRVLHKATDTLREVIERMPESQLAKHAAACLSAVAVTPGLVLNEVDGRVRLQTEPARPEVARPLLGVAFGDLDTAAETFGHIRLTEQVEGAATALAREGEQQQGAKLAEDLADTLQSRGVLPRVVAGVRDTARTIAGS